MKKIPYYGKILIIICCLFFRQNQEHMNISSLLQKFGLTSKEAALFVAAIELGTGSVQDLSTRAGVSRPTSYATLEKLREKGLVTTFRRKHVRYYAAENPQEIVRWSEARIRTLKEILPALQKRAGTGRHRPTVRFYEGKDGVEHILEEILSEATRLYAFASADDLFRKMERFEGFVRRRIQKKIFLQVILRDSPKAQERQKKGPQELREVRLISSRYDFSGLSYLWKDKVALFSFGEEMVAVVLQNASIAATERAKFESLWNLLSNKEPTP